MKLLEEIKVVGFRRVWVEREGKVTIREASGTVIVEIDEDGGLRSMAHRAIDSKGRKCKSGPIHVRFVGKIAEREARPDETLPRGIDDVFAAHPWAWRPR